MSEQTSSIISKVWGMCGPLRDDGVSYGDYLEQLTYLIFLKMSDEYAKPPYKRQTGIPAGCSWADMCDLKGTELEEKYKTESNLIEGCQSRVWLQADYEDGKIIFKGESDAVIVKGIVSLLINVLSGHTPQEILDTDLYFIEQIGLKEHLSPTRSNGLVAMVKQMRMYALAYRTKEQG